MQLLRFKMLSSGYPPFDLPKGLLDEVDMYDFFKTENERLPLFIGTHFGSFPKDISFKSFEGGKIAVLCRSLLSGSQVAMNIYKIEKGRKITIQNISFSTPFWRSENLKRYEECTKARLIKIPEFYLYEFWYYLKRSGIIYKGNDLNEVYTRLIIKAYRDFVISCYDHRTSNWIDFLCSERSEHYLDLFHLLDRYIRGHYMNIEDIPLPLKDQLQLIENIENPYAKRKNKSSLLIEEFDILLISDIGLCIHYNAHINKNSFESESIQKGILKELRQRNFYIKNEHLIRHHANPIEIRYFSGIPVVKLYDELPYRTHKDELPLEECKDVTSAYEHFYGKMKKYTDVELVKEINKNMGKDNGSIESSSKDRAIKDQFKDRSIDISAIVSSQLKQEVIVTNRKLVPIAPLPIKKFEPILKNYLLKVFRGIEFDFPNSFERKKLNSINDRYMEICSKFKKMIKSGIKSLISISH